MKYTACLTIINPKSTQSAAAVEQLSDLTDFFPEAQRIEYKMSSRDFKDTSHILKKLQALPKDALVLIIGGDGTINMIVSAIINGDLAAKLIAVPIKGGNASDIAHMLHGKDADNIKSILETGQEQLAYAIDVHIDTKHQLALAYISFGALAFTMQQLDGVARDNWLLRKLRFIALLLEVAYGMKALFLAKRIVVDTGDGTSAKYYDITYVNGSRIAKVYHTPNRLTKPRYSKIMIAHKHPVLLRHMAALLAMYRRRAPTPTNDRLKFVSSTWMQIDGEVELLPAGTVVMVAKEMKPYRVLRSTS